MIADQGHAGNRAHVERQWKLTAENRPGWTDIYRASVRADYRRPVLEAFLAALPFEKILDLGCNCGALVPLFLYANPQVEVFGVDLAPNAIAEAKRDYPGHTWVCASLVDWLPSMAPYAKFRFDVVMSGSVLCALVPTDIDVVLDALCTMATRTIVLQEPTTTPRFGEGLSPSGMPEWRYDYEAKLKARGWTMVSRVWQEITTDRPGAVMAFRKTDQTGAPTR